MMLKLIAFSSFVFVSFCACNSGTENNHMLTLADVKFPNPEMDAIRRNGIRQSHAYDTAELYRANPEARKDYGKRIRYGYGDTESHRVLGKRIVTIFFDSLGREIFQVRNETFGFAFHCGENLWTRYDKYGLINGRAHKEHERNRDTVYHLLLPEKHQLLAIDRAISDDSSKNDTVLYKLDLEGKPICSEWSSNYRPLNDEGVPVPNSTVYATYSYTDDGRLSMKVSEVSFSYDSTENFTVTERYYYSGSYLDSFIKTTDYSDYRNKYQKDRTEKIIYGKNGLRESGYIYPNQSMTEKEKKLISDTLHVYYLHDTTVDH